MLGDAAAFPGDSWGRSGGTGCGTVRTAGAGCRTLLDSDVTHRLSASLLE